MSRAETAAAFLREARLAGRREPAIPEACAPRDEDEAKAVWQALHAIEDRRIVGWKIGATATAAQQAMGLSGPFAGHICEGMVDEGAEIDYRFADLLGPIYESEYGFRLSADLPARAEPYSREEVEAAIGSLIAGIELPERRLADDQPLGPIGHHRRPWRHRALRRRARIRGLARYRLCGPGGEPDLQRRGGGARYRPGDDGPPGRGSALARQPSLPALASV